MRQNTTTVGSAVASADAPDKEGAPASNLPATSRARRSARHDLKSTMQSPTQFKSLFSDYDLYLFGEGAHHQIYEKLGAHVRASRGVSAVNFAVWAPNARQVSVVGNFNDWDPLAHPLHRTQGGIWENAIPKAGVGDLYKFHIVDHRGRELLKCDPFAFASELPPKSASVVERLSDYSWQDGQWMTRRAAADPLSQPISIYEVHLGSWRQGGDNEHGWLNYRDLAHQLAEYCQKMGYTHVELLPVSEHPYTGSWGYQPVGYYAPTSRYGSPQDFMYFVDFLHQHEIGVIIDWVPAHFPRDAHGLARFDGTALYEHADPRQGEHPDWGTLIFNYGRNEVKNFLISNALFWLDKYHVDGLRVDAVASMLYLDYSREEGEWLPNKFGGRENIEAVDLLRQFNERAHADFPGILTIAEESTAWPGVSRPTYNRGLGFSIKWNMGWMNDTLRYMRHEPIHRKYHHDEITFSMVYAFSENFALPLSHDEVVHGKGSLIDQMPGDVWRRFANLRLLYSYMWTHPGKKLLFMGNDFAQWSEWDVDKSIDWHLLQSDNHQGINRLVADLNKLLKGQPALYEQDFSQAGFEWIDCHDAAASLLTYVRKGTRKDDFLVVACNFTPVVRQAQTIRVPKSGDYRELFNSDSAYYGGTNVGNLGLVTSVQKGGDVPSITVQLPPLATVVFQRSAV